MKLVEIVLGRERGWKRENGDVSTYVNITMYPPVQNRKQKRKQTNEITSS
jgi:hypothetical protein